MRDFPSIKIYFGVAAVVYLVTYAGRIVEDLSYWPAFAALIFAFGLRGAVAIQSRSLRSTRLPTE